MEAIHATHLGIAAKLDACTDPKQADQLWAEKKEIDKLGRRLLKEVSVVL